MAIKKISSQTKFSLCSSLFYEGQIPSAACLLLEGRIQFLKNKKIKHILKPGSLIGLYELMSNFPVEFEAVVTAESTVCFLDKSTILEAVDEKTSSLALLLKGEAF